MNFSDSDPTEYISDLDTGQDGGDECDTDELLDMDFIDTGSVQEIIDKNLFENKGSCSYHHNNVNVTTMPTVEKRQSRLRKSSKIQNDESGLQRRRKRLTRTRKSTSRDCRDRSASNRNEENVSPFENGEERGTKSVGGTPVSLRRNKANKPKG